MRLGALATLLIAAMTAGGNAPTTTKTNTDKAGGTLQAWTHRLQQQQQALLQQTDKLFGNQRLPPSGALYVGHIKLPILGQQTFMLRIVSRTRAKIILVGAMNLDEYGHYTVASSRPDEPFVSLLVNFNEPTLALLDRYKTRIRAVKYFDGADVAELEICPLILPTIRVRLNRVR